MTISTRWKAYKEASNDSKDTNTIGKDKNKGIHIAVKNSMIRCVCTYLFIKIDLK